MIKNIPRPSILITCLLLGGITLAGLSSCRSTDRAANEPSPASSIKVPTPVPLLPTLPPAVQTLESSPVDNESKTAAEESTDAPSPLPIVFSIKGREAIEADPIADLSVEPGSAALPGGKGTVFDTTPNAFSHPMDGLERMEELLFFVGNSFFNQNWVTAPASTTARDGLGPMFNARSCAGCHFKDGRGRPPDFAQEFPTGFLARLSIPGEDPHGAPLPEPNYGGQLQVAALQDIEAEGQIQIEYEEIPGTFADGTPYSLRQPRYTLLNLAYGDPHPDLMISPRVANQMIGLGLLEAIPADSLLALADPDDDDSDGISGRPNTVWDEVKQTTTLGRFGWKANQPNMVQQVASAFAGDMGIATNLFPEPNCTAIQVECLAAPNGAPESHFAEIDDDDFDKVVLYSSTLAVPARRNLEDPQVQLGEQLFTQVGCTKCHTPMHQTGEHPTIQALSNQRIYPYTDLLLHDMGEALADNRPDFEATGTEWRTPPLWGLGLVETVNRHTYYLHDGRARSILEAILWHGGEADQSQKDVLELSKEERDALVAFVKSL